jgi:hypothetical protein
MGWGLKTLAIGPSGRPLVDVKSLNLEEGEEVNMQITAFAEAHHCLWEFRLTVQYQGSAPETVVIRSDGTPTGPPFETAAWNPDWPYSGGVHEVGADGLLHEVD